MICCRTDSEWSRSVLERDRYICVYPGCNRTDVSAHHVFDRRYSKLRLVLENGIALCSVHHRMIQEAGCKREKLSRLLVGDLRYNQLLSILGTNSDSQISENTNQKL